MNQASIAADVSLACDVLAARFPGQLQAIFSPQHGIWGEAQANMIESPDSTYPPLGLPVYSLYGETRTPTAPMLAGLDALLIDLQDVGTRVYTFAWTVRECLRACSAAGIPVVILDRPNPLGGVVVEGPLLDEAYRSFVGEASIPLRHGLTLGELGCLFNEEQQIGCDLTVVSMRGWRRDMLFSETGRHWVPPSPNMPRPATALVYPGQVLLEGTSLSEGRGTTTPFELCGAPELDPWDLLAGLQAFPHEGLVLRPVRFQPTFDKHCGRSCGGLALEILEGRSVRSVAVTVALLAVARNLLGEHLQWLAPPYEYEWHKPPIDILFGSDRLRVRLDSGERLTREDHEELIGFDSSAWGARTAAVRLYE
jgi:uncharacterized protein YbbC (DUF1343 family)